MIMVYSSIICAVISLIVNCVPNRKILGYTIGQQIIDLLPNLLLSVSMLVCVVGVEKLFVNFTSMQYGWIPLIVEILVGILVYFGFSLIFKNESLIYIVKSIKSFKKKFK